MATITYAEIHEELAKRLSLGEFWPVVGTSTGGDTDTLIDTVNLGYTSADANSMDGRYIWQELHNTNKGEKWTQVTRGGWDTANSTLEVKPAVDTWNNATEKAPYIVSDKHPTYLRDSINRILRNQYYETYFPLSSQLIGNDANDMEPSTVATDYSKSATSTLAVETTIVRRGAQSLKNTAGAATQYGYSASFGVSENHQYFTAAYCYVTQGDDGEFRIINVQDTNATIENATSDEPSWLDLAFQFTAPSGCEQVQAWMISAANTDDTYWEDFVLLDTSQKVFLMPSFIKWGAQVKDIVTFGAGSGGPAGDNDYRVDEREPRSWPAWGLHESSGAGRVNIWISPAAAQRVYIKALRPYAALSSDTDTTYADLDTIVGHTIGLIGADTDGKGEQYLAALRQYQLGGAVSQFSERVGV